jgi:hypothetical protein
MRNIVPILLFGFFATMSALLMGFGAYWDTFEHAEPQPIAFPHDTHAGKLGLECTHCHTSVEKSRFATVPAVSVCMTCHENAQIESPELDKLKQYWSDQEPIPWVRIHSMADHVYFSHKRHIKAGVECATCHGDMTVVKEVKKVRTFNMGFCVGCHRANNAPQECSTCHK